MLAPSFKSGRELFTLLTYKKVRKLELSATIFSFYLLKKNLEWWMGTGPNLQPWTLTIVTYYTRSHQFPFLVYWSIQIIQKLFDATPNHVYRPFKIVSQLLLQSRQSSGKISPLFSLTPLPVYQHHLIFQALSTEDENHSAGWKLVFSFSFHKTLYPRSL